jgi:fructokinase
VVKIISIGEILWDVFPDAERLGGAPFNFAVNAHRLGHDVRFISAVGQDDRGFRALNRVTRLGLSVEFVEAVADAPTGTVTIELDSGGEPTYTIHRPAAYDFVKLDDSDLGRLTEFQADWIYYGTLYQMHAESRTTAATVVHAMPRAKRFYDVNLRSNSYTPELVSDLLREADVVKLNASEAKILAPRLSTFEEFCRTFARDYDLMAICVTLGKDGCAALTHGDYVESPGFSIAVADPVGAGDAFAAAFLHGIDAGWPASEIARFANRAGANAASFRGAISD